MSIEETYLLRKDNPIWNTSYPLSPEDWSSYRIERNLPFDNEREMSFYVHIPFCRQLCSFCEYTRIVCPDEKAQAAYIDTLYSDISRFKESNQNILLRGFDWRKRSMSTHSERFNPPTFELENGSKTA